MPTPSAAAVMKVMIAFFSRTGHTERVAREMAAWCGADLEQIQDLGVAHSGLMGYLQCGWQAIFGTHVAIRPASHDPGRYDLVVIGTPVWNWSLAAPVRTFTQTHAARFKRVAFFCTEGGSGDQRVFGQLQSLCNQAPLATLAINEHELAVGAYRAPLERFASQLIKPT